MSDQAGNAGSIALSSNKHCLHGRGFYTSIHSLAHISHLNQCKNMYALGLRETKFPQWSVAHNQHPMQGRATNQNVSKKKNQKFRNS
jgi:hypothetical protein